MSWMDSWSRPSKHQATPAPFYLLPGGEATPYCHSCGRVINSRRTGAAAAAEDKGAATAVKYCSSRCRSHKPGKLDREIEGVFAGLLDGIVGGEGDGKGAVGGVGGGGGRGAKGKAKGKGGSKTKKKVKGDARLLVSCDEVERYMFHRDGSDAATCSGSGTEDGHADEDADAGGDAGVDAAAGIGSPPVREPPRLPQQQHHLTHALHDDGTGTLEDPTGQTTTTNSYNNNPHAPIDYDVLARLSVRSGTRIRPPQSVSEVNGSVGGEKGRAERADETGEMLDKRREGLRRARQREMVRCAARRGVVFGFGGGGGGGEGEAGGRRKCEAVMSGKVVEPSFAKGDWSVRWRE